MYLVPNEIPSHQDRLLTGRARAGEGIADEVVLPRVGFD